MSEVFAYNWAETIYQPIPESERRRRDDHARREIGRALMDHLREHKQIVTVHYEEDVQCYHGATMTHEHRITITPVKTVDVYMPSPKLWDVDYRSVPNGTLWTEAKRRVKRYVQSLVRRYWDQVKEAA